MTKEVEIKPNSIVFFQADHKDNDGKKAKGRRHIVLEVEGNDWLLLKLTGQKKELHVMRAGYADCLDKISYLVYSPKVLLSLDNLKLNDYQYFYVCSLHTNGCLEKEKFETISKKIEEYRKNELSRDKDPVIVKQLKKPENLPWWVVITDEEKRKEIIKKNRAKFNKKKI